MAETFVYLIHNVNKNEVKIGYSFDPVKRLSQMQTATTDKLSILLTIKGGKKEEQLFHESLAAYRISGEWFRNEYAVLKTMLDYAATVVYDNLEYVSEIEVMVSVKEAAEIILKDTRAVRITVSQIRSAIPKYSKKQIGLALEALSWTKQSYKNGAVYYIKPKPSVITPTKVLPLSMETRNTSELNIENYRLKTSVA
jgi:hypothetical protein